MPEMVEIELYRLRALDAIGSRVCSVEVADPKILAGTLTAAGLSHALGGLVLTEARRQGKVLFLDFAAARRRPVVVQTLAMRFGMTGTLIVGGVPGVDALYSATRFDERYVRLRLRMAPAGRAGAGKDIVLHDPRRFGRVRLDTAGEHLGPDALTITQAQLAEALGVTGDRLSATGGMALKARLLDQARIAGVGNLIADEVLWRAGLDPRRPAAGLSPAECRRLRTMLRSTIVRMLAAGGSHTGRLMAERHPGGVCPSDGAELARATVGGRTTWWCPAHQH